ncbi:MAG: choice-of-anchor J domain-containing protein [Cytophagales bacterium]|nr:choice-of-anchor J domain-containing protein [Cytophagales bacterium]
MYYKFTLQKSAKKSKFTLPIALLFSILSCIYTYAQVTYPSPQPLPYVQNFDASASTTYPAGIQGFRSGSLTVFGYNTVTDEPIANRIISSVLDYATITTAGTGVTTSTIHLITGSGAGNSLAVSIFNRAAGFVTALDGTGYQDIRVSYDITQLEVESITSIIGYAYLEYSVSGMSGYVSVPGSYYSTENLPSGTVTSYVNLSLPNAMVADKPDIRLRWLTFSSQQVSNYISFSFDNVSVSGTAILFSTLAPQALPYIQNFSTFSIATGFPSGFAGFRTGTLPAYDYNTANTAAMLNRNLTSPDYDIAALTSGGVNTAGTLHVVTSPGGNGVLTSLFDKSAGYIMALNTSGWRNIKLSYEVTHLEVETTPGIDGSGYFQYRTDNYSPFTAIPGTYYNGTGRTTGQKQSFVNITLPGVVENLAKVQLRWLAFPSAQVVNYLSFAISNISITGDNIPAPASKLVVESVTPTLKLINTPLTLIVSSKNLGDVEVPVIANTIFTLSTTGTGLSGAGTYTISGGSSRATVTGVSFSAANTAITISVNRTSGDALSSGTSTTFNILSADPDAPVMLPYNQTFGTAPIIQGTNTVSGMRFYRAGSASWKNNLADAVVIPDGSYTLRAYQGPITGTTRCTSTATGHINNGLGPQSYNIGADVKLNISLGSRTFINILSLNTTGMFDVSYKYDVQMIENFNTSSNGPTTCTGYMALQYRVGTSAGWNTLNGTTYTTSTVIDQITTFAGYLPPAAYDQPVVQLRWITYQSSDMTIADYLSFALDNIEIASKKASKLSIKSISPASPTAGFDFTLTAEAQNEYGIPYAFSSVTGLSIAASGAGTLTGILATTVGAGATEVVFSGLKYNTTASGMVLTLATTSGQQLMPATATINVLPFVGATKLSITSIFATNGGKILPNSSISVVIQALNNSNAAGVVTSTTGVSLIINGGAGAISGNTSINIPAGQSSVTLTGLLYNQIDNNLTLTATATSGDALTASPASAPFQVGKVATAVQILGVLPTGSIIVGNPITVRIKLVDADGEGAYVLANAGITVALGTGIGTLSGTLTGTAISRTDTTIDIKGAIYSVADTAVTISVTVQGLTAVVSSKFAVLPNPLSGITVLYKEDFEKTIKIAGQANPVLPAGMKMYNRDGKAGIASFYQDYGTDAYVIRRIRQRGYVAIGEDEAPTQSKTMYYDNSGSAYPDSNFVAFSTSYFDNDPLLNPTADRWLVTPKVSLSGGNLKFSLQAMSFTSSGNYEDKFQMLFSQVAPGTTLNVSDWEAFTMKAEGLVSYPDSATYTALTVPVTYSVALPPTFEGQEVYFAVRLVTPSPGGDRIAVDNIYITSSSNATSVDAEISSLSSMQIFPNPAIEKVTLSFNSAKSGIMTTYIIGALGNVVYENSSTIDVGAQWITVPTSNLGKGLYLVKVVTPTQTYTSKFIKK